MITITPILAIALIIAVTAVGIAALTGVFTRVLDVEKQQEGLNKHVLYIAIAAFISISAVTIAAINGLAQHM